MKHGDLNPEWARYQNISIFNAFNAETMASDAQTYWVDTTPADVVLAM